MTAQPIAAEPPEEPQNGPQSAPEPPGEGEAPEKPAKKATTNKTTSKRRGSNRASGKPAASEEAEKSADEAVTPMKDEQLPDEREEWFRAPGFRRMKVVWEGEDAQMLQRAKFSIQKQVDDLFPEAMLIMSDLFDIVREKEADPTTGEIKTDQFGNPVWKERFPGSGVRIYVEDWTLLTRRQTEDFIFRIVGGIYDWEQRAADLWTESMFAKAMFTERYSIEFDSPIHGTIEDRNARGNVEAAEDRYFAILNAAVSRKADALIRSMNSMMMRLKDSLEH